MKISVSELRNLFYLAAKKFLSEEEAKYFASETVETSLRKPSHSKYDTGIINDIKSWKGQPSKINKIVDLPGYTKYDFNGLGPSLKIKELHDDLEKKANSNGIAMISVVNSAGMHTMHLWTQGLAKRGLFAIGSWNGGPDAVIPINGTKGIFGTNPFTYGFPGDKGDIVIDMATSEIPYFKIVDAKKNKTTLPENTAVDDSGEITTDPEKSLDEQGVANLLPMGGNYKGYIINYLMEIMTSALVGAKSSSEMNNGYVETEHGGFIIAIAIDKVTNRKQYDESIMSTNKEIRSQAPRKGADKVIVPGDNNLEKYENISEDTLIEVDEDFIKDLDSI